MLLDISQTISRECQEPRLFLATAHSRHSKVKEKNTPHQSVLTTKNHQPKTQTNPEDIQSIDPIELQLSEKRKGTSEAFKV